MKKKVLTEKDILIKSINATEKSLSSCTDRAQQIYFRNKLGKLRTRLCELEKKNL